MNVSDLIRAAEILGINARALRNSYSVVRGNRRDWCGYAAEKTEHDDCVRLARALRREAKRRAA